MDWPSYGRQRGVLLLAVLVYHVVTAGGGLCVVFDDLYVSALFQRSCS